MEPCNKCKNLGVHDAFCSLQTNYSDGNQQAATHPIIDWDACIQDTHHVSASSDGSRSARSSYRVGVNIARSSYSRI